MNTNTIENVQVHLSRVTNVKTANWTKLPHAGLKRFPHKPNAIPQLKVLGCILGLVC